MNNSKMSLKTKKFYLIIKISHSKSPSKPKKPKKKLFIKEIF